MLFITVLNSLKIDKKWEMGMKDMKVVAQKTR